MVSTAGWLFAACAVSKVPLQGAYRYGHRAINKAPTTVDTCYEANIINRAVSDV
jgi:hypothetical protein